MAEWSELSLANKKMTQEKQLESRLPMPPLGRKGSSENQDTACINASGVVNLSDLRASMGDFYCGVIHKNVQVLAGVCKESDCLYNRD